MDNSLILSIIKKQKKTNEGISALLAIITRTAIMTGVNLHPEEKEIIEKLRRDLE